jgi:hypothetical protein
VLLAGLGLMVAASAACIFSEELIEQAEEEEAGVM